MATTSFVYLRPQLVWYVRRTGPYNQSARDAWQVLFDWVNANKFRSQISHGFGLLRDNSSIVPPEKCRYEACIEPPTGLAEFDSSVFQIQRLPGGAYARRRHVGSTDSLRDTIAEMRDQWAPSQGLCLDNRRPLVEIYLDDPVSAPGEKRRIDICLPVSPSAQNDHSAA